MSEPSEFDATALDSDANRLAFAEHRQQLLDCLAASDEFPWLTNDGSAEHAAYEELKQSLLARQPGLWGSWQAWRERRDVVVDFIEQDCIDPLQHRIETTPAATRVRDQLLAELRARRIAKDFFSRLYDVLGRSEFMTFANRASVANSAIGKSLGELYDKVDKKAPLELDAGKVLDVLGKVVAIIPGAEATGAGEALKAAKTLYQVQAFLSWASDLIRSGKTLPWGRGAPNAGSWGNVISTLGDIDVQQRAMFADARTQIGRLKQCIFWRWGRLDYLDRNMLRGQIISDELREYIAKRIYAGWNYVMWRQLVWTMFKVRAQGPVVSNKFIFPDSYPIDFDTFRTEHRGKPSAKERLGYVFKGEIADTDRGGRSPQVDGLVYACYWRNPATSGDDDIYHFFKYRLVSSDDKVPFTNDMFDYLRDSYGIERRHFVLATTYDADSKTDMSVFGPSGRYFVPEDNPRLDTGHTIKLSTHSRNAEFPAYSKKANRYSQSPDRIDFTLLEGSQSGKDGAVTNGEFKKVHECYRIRWVDGLGRIETVFADDGNRHYFGDGQYVLWSNGAQAVDEDRIKLDGSWGQETIAKNYLRGIDPGIKGNWPGVWTSNLQASLPVGDRQVLFFRSVLDLDFDRCRPELLVLQFDMRTKTTVGAAKRVLDVWPDFPWAQEGIDTAVTLFGKHYFFRGDQMVVYDAIDGIGRTGGARVRGPVPVEEYFDTSINPHWNWKDGCSAAWLDGMTLYVVRNDEYLWFDASPARRVDAEGFARLKTIVFANLSVNDFAHVMRVATA